MVNRLDDAAASIASLLEETAGLRDEVAADREERARMVRRLIALFITVAIALGGLLTLALMNRMLIEKQSELTQRVQECTTSGGRCFEESQRRSAQLVRDIVRQNAQVKYRLHVCARESTTSKEFTACVRVAYPDAIPSGKS